MSRLLNFIHQMGTDQSTDSHTFRDSVARTVTELQYTTNKFKEYRNNGVELCSRLETVSNVNNQYNATPLI